jgi:hypothetical protein
MGKKQKVEVTNNAPWGYVLFMAYIGAAVYFIERNEGFVGFLHGLLQAAVWPAYVLYETLTSLSI